MPRGGGGVLRPASSSAMSLSLARSAMSSSFLLQLPSLSTPAGDVAPEGPMEYSIQSSVGADRGDLKRLSNASEEATVQPKRGGFAKCKGLLRLLSLARMRYARDIMQAAGAVLAGAYSVLAKVPLSTTQMSAFGFATACILRGGARSVSQTFTCEKDDFASGCGEPPGLPALWVPETDEVSFFASWMHSGRSISHKNDQALLRTRMRRSDGPRHPAVL